MSLGSTESRPTGVGRGRFAETSYNGGTTTIIGEVSSASLPRRLRGGFSAACKKAGNR